MKHKLLSSLSSLVIILILVVGLLGVILPTPFAFAEQPQQVQVQNKDKSPSIKEESKKDTESKGGNPLEATTSEDSQIKALESIVCISSSDCPTGKRCIQRRCR